MNYIDWVLAGFVATSIMTIFTSSVRGLGWTRMDLTFMLGTLFSERRDQALWIGTLIHFINGWVFSFIYFALFWRLEVSSWILGPLFSIVHGLFMLTVVLYLLPSFHPRMASENDGPDPTEMLEPPGFLALHYGRMTPILTIIAHLIFGLVLGGYSALV